MPQCGLCVGTLPEAVWHTLQSAERLGGDDVAAFVSVGAFSIAAMTNDVGFFYGQNVQNAWDSHSPLQFGAGYTMGNWSVNMPMATMTVTPSVIMQPIIDSDVKDDFSPSWEGP